MFATYTVGRFRSPTMTPVSSSSVGISSHSDDENRRRKDGYLPPFSIVSHISMEAYTPLITRHDGVPAVLFCGDEKTERR